MFQTSYGQSIFLFFLIQKLNLTGMAIAESPPSTPPVVRRSMSGIQYTVYKQVSKISLQWLDWLVVR